MAPAPGLPDWRDPAAYAGLAGLGPAAFAWEWLRRSPAYRRDCHGHAEAVPGTIFRRLRPAGGAARYGLHAFEDPGLSALFARPVWTAAHVPVLHAEALPAGAGAFDLGRFASLATLVTSAAGVEHLLLSDGRTSLRLDIIGGTLAEGPVSLAVRLEGMQSLDASREPLRRLHSLWRTGVLPPPAASPRAGRMILLLRAGDALAAGAGQRAIAAELLNREALQARWRAEAPSLRTRGQRLVSGARRLADGGWRSLLRPRPGRVRACG